MAGVGQLHHVAGPWKGIEERYSHQTDQHCEAAINVDFSGGTIAPRPGLSRVSAVDVQIIRPQMFVAERDVGEPMILMAGRSTVNGNIILHISRMSGATVARLDLTGTYGEPPTRDWRCSMVRIRFANTAANGYLSSRTGMLIVSKFSALLWEPGVNPAVVRKPNLTEDAFKADVVNRFYWNHPPRGEICTWHQNRVWFAGFRQGEVVTLDGAIPAIQQEIIKEAWLIDGRSGMRLGRNVVAYSDPNDPFGLAAGNELQAHPDETVTGLKAHRESLAVFTDTSIYLLHGIPEEGARMRKVSYGVGCVAPWGIEEVAGALFFLSHDGAYVFDGDQPRKISKPIDSMWTGQRDAKPPLQGMATALQGLLKAPWQFAAERGWMVQSVHHQRRNQVWWMIPVKSQHVTEYGRNHIVLVYDYANDAWSYFCQYQPESRSFETAAAVTRQGEEHLFVYSNDRIRKYGGDVWDEPSGKVGRPFVFVSPRLLKTNEGRLSFNHIRLRQNAWGRKGLVADDNVHLSSAVEVNAFEAMLPGSSNDEKTAQDVVLDTHPMEHQTPPGYFLSEATLAPAVVIGGPPGSDGTAFCTPKSWWTNRVDLERPFLGNWLQWGIHQRTSGRRPPMVTIAEYSVEYEPTGALSR